MGTRIRFWYTIPDPLQRRRTLRHFLQRHRGHQTGHRYPIHCQRVGERHQRQSILKPGNMKSSKELNNEAVASQMEGRFEDAETSYRLALEADAGNATAHGNLGFLLMQRGNIDEAMKHFETALSINADSDTTHVNKANLHLLMNEMDLAFEHYSKAVAL